MGFCGIHLRPIAQEVLKITIRKMTLKKYTCKIISKSVVWNDFINRNDVFNNSFSLVTKKH